MPIVSHVMLYPLVKKKKSVYVYIYILCVHVYIHTHVCMHRHITYIYKHTETCKIALEEAWIIHIRTEVVDHILLLLLVLNIYIYSKSRDIEYYNV